MFQDVDVQDQVRSVPELGHQRNLNVLSYGSSHYCLTSLMADEFSEILRYYILVTSLGFKTDAAGKHQIIWV